MMALLTLPQAEKVAYFLYRYAREAALPFPILSGDPCPRRLNPIGSTPMFHE